MSISVIREKDSHIYSYHALIIIIAVYRKVSQFMKGAKRIILINILHWDFLRGFKHCGTQHHTVESAQAV